jgi:hypothetical protein
MFVRSPAAFRTRYALFSGRFKRPGQFIAGFNALGKIVSQLVNYLTVHQRAVNVRPGAMK